MLPLERSHDPFPKNKKKPTWRRTQKVLHHVGLLVNGPPSENPGLPFI
jgi:hypothetical protein